MTDILVLLALIALSFQPEHAYRTLVPPELGTATAASTTAGHIRYGMSLSNCAPVARRSRAFGYYVSIEAPSEGPTCDARIRHGCAGHPNDIDEQRTSSSVRW
jgi:hypothetical protein